MRLPTQTDFGDIECLDVAYAWKTFGGKTIAEAYELIRENALAHQENLSWMSRPAFVFYFPAAASYLMSTEASGDSDGVSSIAGLLENRLRDDPEAIAALSEVVVSLCGHVIDNFSKYEVNEGIYGELIPRYENIKNRTSRLT
jgi:hypothetical protein